MGEDSELSPYHRAWTAVAAAAAAVAPRPKSSGVFIAINLNPIAAQSAPNEMLELRAAKSEGQNTGRQRHLSETSEQI